MYDNTNKGALFINKRRTTDRHPNLTGKIDIEGVEYWISAWTNHKKSDGEKYLSLNVTPVEEKPVHKNTTSNMDDGSDDIPF
jgi:hypothetical protein